MNSLNDVNCIHDNKNNNISECNLLHGILNSSKRTKNTNRHYYFILDGWMNTYRGKVKFKKFWILLDVGCISTVITRSLITKFKTK